MANKKRFIKGSASSVATDGRIGFTIDVSLIKDTTINGSLSKTVLTVRKMLKQIVIDMIKHDSDAGLSYAQLVAKYKVSRTTVVRSIRGTR